MAQSFRLICIDFDAMRALDLRNMRSIAGATLDAMKAQILVLRRGLCTQRRSLRLKASIAFVNHLKSERRQALAALSPIKILCASNAMA